MGNMKMKYKRYKVLAIMLFCIFFVNQSKTMAQENTIYEYSINNINEDPVSLSKYKGYVVLIVNVASKCGFTNQYNGLQALYEKYKSKKFVVLGIPSNQFMGQEPGTNKEIKEFCTLNYGITFPMFAKTLVRGKDMHPLYKFLTTHPSNKQFSGKVTWNFNKFLINKEGYVVARFSSNVKPNSKQLVENITALL